MRQGFEGGGIARILRIAVPQRVLVELQALIGDATEHHRPEPPVAQRQRLLPHLGGLAVPQRVAARRHPGGVPAKPRAVGPGGVDVRALGRAKRMADAGLAGQRRHSQQLDLAILCPGALPAAGLADQDPVALEGAGVLEMDRGPPLLPLQLRGQPAGALVDEREAVSPRPGRVRGVGALDGDGQRVARRGVVARGKADAGHNAGAEAGRHHPTAVVGLVEMLGAEVAIERLGHLFVIGGVGALHRHIGAALERIFDRHHRVIRSEDILGLAANRLAETAAHERDQRRMIE